MIKEITPEFAEKVRVALLEELGTQINNMTEVLASSLEIEPDEAGPGSDSALLRNILIALSQSIGYSAAVFNQLYILETGEVPDETPKKIGFHKLHDESHKEKKKREED